MRVLGQGTEFIAFIVFARRIGSENFGSFWLAFLLCRYGGLLGDLGASLRGARDVASQVDAGRLRALVARRWRVSGLVGIAFALALWALRMPELAPLAVCVVTRGTNRDWMRLGAGQGAAAGVPAAVQGLAALSLAFLVSDAGDAAIATAGAYALGWAGSLYLNPLPSSEASDNVSAPQDGTTGWVLAGSMADQVSLSADSFLLGAVTSVQAAGIYGAIYRLPNAIGTVVGLVAMTVTATLTKGFTINAAVRPELVRRLLRGSGAAAITIALAAPAAAVLVVPVYGEEFRSGRGAAAILVLAIAVVCFGAPLHSIALALHQDRAYSSRLILAAGVNLASNLVLIPTLGLIGAALATLISSTVLVGMLFHLAASTSGALGPAAAVPEYLRDELGG